MKQKRKYILAIIVMLVCSIILGLLLTVSQTGILKSAQRKRSLQKLETVKSLLEQRQEKEDEAKDTFDQLYISKANTLAFFIQNTEKFDYTNKKMRELKENAQVENVIVLDQKGNVIAKAQEDNIDYRIARFNELRTVFTSKAQSTPFDVEKSEKDMRYYGAYIDDAHMIVVTVDANKLAENLEKNASYSDTLSGVTLGINGYAFVVSTMNYCYTYHPESKKIGSDALQSGLSIEQVSDGYDGYIDVDGEKMYAVSAQYEDEVIVCVVPEEEMIGSRNITVAMGVIVMLIIVSMIILYDYLLEEEQEKNGNRSENLVKTRKYYYNQRIVKKLVPIAAAGIIAILCITIYVQKLFALSQQSTTNNARVQEVEKTIEANNKKIKELTNEYDEQYLAKCKLGAYIVQNTAEQKLTQDYMKQLKNVLQVYHVYYVGTDGINKATDTDFWNFKLSEDSKDQSYEFWDILNGKTLELIQDYRSSDMTGEKMQHIAVAITDENHNIEGMFQMAVLPKRLQNMLKNTDLSVVLSEIQIGKNGVAFAIDREDKTFTYYPNEKLIGKSVTQYGMEEYEIKDGFSDYITIDNEKLYATSLEIEDDNIFVYVAVPAENVDQFSMTIAVATAMMSLFCTIIVVLLLTLYGRVGEEEKVFDSEAQKKTRVDEVGSRWNNEKIKWKDMTADQQFMAVIRHTFTMIAIIFLILILLANRLFKQGSIIHYILSGEWNRSVNIFSLTSCLMLVITAGTVMYLVRKFLKWFSETLNAKGETIIRLVNNFLKFATWLGILYFGLSFIGVDTKTLVASAGILSLVVGLGAQSLISDILAGLFIVFEGEFRVGDIIKIGEFRGTVMEIGIRTTKVKEWTGNVKVFANRNVTDVLNMTKNVSNLAIMMGIEYDESLLYVESVLEKTLPALKEKIPQIIDGPYYVGVSELGDNCVNLKIVATTSEADRIIVESSLLREIKLISEEYDISIPYPQMVVHKPSTNYHKADSYVQKEKTEQFVKEQQELSSTIKVEDDDDD